MKFGLTRLSLAAAVAIASVGLLAVEARADGHLEQMLEDGASLLQRGKPAAAAEKFRAVLAEDPSNEDAYALVRKTDFRVFLDMLKAGGDSELVAKRLLALSHSAEVERSSDPTAIGDLVREAVNSGDLDARVAAARKLASAHGEHAVPALWKYLGSNDIDVRANAILALIEIGPDAVAPLAASLSIGSDTQRYNAAKVLQRIGDHRAVPGLQRAAAGADMSATAAGEALDALGGGAETAAASFMDLSKAFFMGDPMVLNNFDGTYVVWSTDGNNLNGRDVPRFLYNYELAEQAAYEALDTDGSTGEARAMIGLVSFAELGAWESLSQEAQATESLADTGKALEGARALAAATGTQDLLGSLRLSMQLGHAEAGGRICDALPTVWDGSDTLKIGNPLVDALAHRDKRFRYGAAMALLRIDPGAAFARSDVVANIAGEAAAEVAVQQVLVIDSDTKNGNNVQRALEGAGYHSVVAHSGAAGLLMAKSTAGFDCVVVRRRLADITPFQVLDDLRNDLRTKNLKTVVMAHGGELGTSQVEFEKRGISSVATTSADSAAVVTAVQEALGDHEDADAARANALSIAASHAIAGSKGGAFDLRGAEAGLLHAVREGAPDDVRIAAMGALANVGTSRAQDVLAVILMKAENAEAVREAAATALGKSVRGLSPSKTAFRALLDAMADESVAVRTAAGAALGSAKLSDADRNEVMKRRRVS